jgi:hypothetical protein
VSRLSRARTLEVIYTAMQLDHGKELGDVCRILTPSSRASATVCALVLCARCWQFGPGSPAATALVTGDVLIPCRRMLQPPPIPYPHLQGEVLPFTFCLGEMILLKTGTIPFIPVRERASLQSCTTNCGLSPHPLTIPTRIVSSGSGSGTMGGHSRPSSRHLCHPVGR